MSTKLSCGPNHTVVLSHRGIPYGWGSPDDSRLGPFSSSSDPLLAAKKLTDSLTDSISCGFSSTCLITSSGQLIQWGMGDARALWDGIRIKRKARTVSCGYEHSLVVDDFGKLWTWGNNSHGELGLGDLVDRLIPTMVQLDVGVKAVGAGANHSLCCTEAGQVYAFGLNAKGQLGLGSQLGYPTPELVGGLGKVVVVDVKCGASHSATLTDEGRLFLFGCGSYGRCGHGYEGDGYYPVENETLAKEGIVVAASLGETHSACIMQDGRLFVWGSGMHGKLGLGDDVSNKSYPVELKRGLLFTAVACGTVHTIASVRDTGQVLSWGLPSTFGRLGRHVNSPSARPEPVEGIPKDEKVGGDAQLAVGLDDSMEQATTETKSGVEPRPIFSSNHILVPNAHRLPHGFSVKMVAIGYQHSLLLTASGSVFAFGSNFYGQCGNSKLAAGLTMTTINTPKEVRVETSASSRISHIACGANHSLLVTIRGEVLGFGHNASYQLGLGLTTDKFTPTPITALTGIHIVTVAGGEAHSGCIDSNGRLFTWGSSDFGKLGLGRPVPEFVTIPTLVDFANSTGDFSFSSSAKPELADRLLQLSCGFEHTLVVTQRGRLFGFGSGFYGRLGHGKTSNEYDPVWIRFEDDFTLVSEVSAGEYHSACVTTKGELYVWGKGDSRLGLGETVDKMSPCKNVMFASSTDVVSSSASSSSLLPICKFVSCGSDHTLVMANDGHVYSFGKNTHGKLGLGANLEPELGPSASAAAATSNRKEINTPESINEQIMHLGKAPGVTRGRGEHTDYRLIATRDNHCLALSSDGHVYVWGKGGRLGLEFGPVEQTKDVDSPHRMDDLNVTDEVTAATSAITVAEGAIATTTALSAISGDRGNIVSVMAMSSIPGSSTNTGIAVPRLSARALALMNARIDRFHRKYVVALDKPSTASGMSTTLAGSFAVAGRATVTTMVSRSFSSHSIATSNYVGGYGLALPIGAIQAMLKLEASNVGLSEAAMKMKYKNVTDLNGRNLELLKRLTREYAETRNMEMTIQFAIEYATRLVASRDPPKVVNANVGVPSSRLSSLFSSSKRLMNQRGDSLLGAVTAEPVVATTAAVTGSSTTMLALSIPPQILGTIPTMEQIMSLFLINPGYLFGLYEKFVLGKNLNPEVFLASNVQWNDLFIGVCRDVYNLSVPYAAHLFQRLSIVIAKDELKRQITANKTFSVFALETKRTPTMFHQLFKLYLTNQKRLSRRIFDSIRPELIRIKDVDLSGVYDERENAVRNKYVRVLSEIGVVMFELFEKFIVEIVFVEYPNIYETMNEYYSTLREHFLVRDEAVNASLHDVDELDDEIAFYIARLAMQSLFIPVLVDHVALNLSMANEKLPSAQTLDIIAKFLCSVATMTAKHSEQESAFKVAVRRYQNVFRGDMAIDVRLDLDEALLAAGDGSREKERDFINSVEEVASRSGMPTTAADSATGGGGGNSDAFLMRVMDVVRPLRIRMLKLFKVDLKRAGSGFFNLDVEIGAGLLREQFRSKHNALVLYPKRRTLEFIHFALYHRLSHRLPQPYASGSNVVVAGRSPAMSTADDDDDDVRTAVETERTNFTSLAEWQVMLDVCFDSYASTASLARVADFPARYRQFDDSWGLSVSIDLKVLDGVALEADALSELLTLDSVTRTPIPVVLSKALNRLVRGGDGQFMGNIDTPMREDVYGLEEISSKIIQNANVDLLSTNMVNFTALNLADSPEFKSILRSLRATFLALEDFGVDETNPDALMRKIAEHDVLNLDDQLIFRDAEKRLTNVSGEDFIKALARMVEDMRFRAHSALLLQCLQTVGDMLTSEISEARIEQNRRKFALKQYAIVMKEGDRGQNYRMVKEISLRLGSDYRLTEPDFMRRMQLQRNASSSYWRSCLGLNDSDRTRSARILLKKIQFADHHLVCGAFISKSYKELMAKNVIMALQKGEPFGSPHAPHRMTVEEEDLMAARRSSAKMLSRASGTVNVDVLDEDDILPPRGADELDNPLLQCQGRSGKDEKCPFSVEAMKRGWSKIARRLKFHFSISSDGRFSVLVVYSSLTVVARVDTNISVLINLARSFYLDWHPAPKFPVLFRVRNLLTFVQEMTLQSQM